MMNIPDQFRDALRARHIIPPANIIADGKIYRCDTEGKNGKGDAAYCLCLDGIPAGGFQNWQDGLGWQPWRADIGHVFSADQQEVHKASVQSLCDERESRHAAARIEAAAIWESAQFADPDHPYHRRKSLRGAPGVKLYRGDLVIGGMTCDGALIIPMRDAAGELQTLQFIAPDGEKRFLRGGKKHGCFFLTSTHYGILRIAEGYATGLTLAENTYASDVAVAGDAGNLEPVARALRLKHPHMKLIICADDDHQVPGNPGLTKAIAAARAVGGKVILPWSSADRPDGATDFNDLFRLRGRDAVERAISQSKWPDEAACLLKRTEREDEAIWPSSDDCPGHGGRQPAKNPIVSVPARFKLKTIVDVLQEAQPRWLVQELLQEKSLVVIYGGANTGKSFLALDVGLALARGIDWFGRKVQPGVVVYLAIEGRQRNRIEAYLTYHQLSQPPLGFRLIDAPLNLLTRPPKPTDAREIIEAIRAQLGNTPIAAVIIDTLNQALQGGDENSSEDMGAFIANANEIRVALGCAVVVIHHSGKVQQQGARGHSSLKGAVDTEIEVTSDKNTGLRTAKVTKQRDGRDDAVVHYMLHSVDLAPDPNDPGKNPTSCVVVPPPLTMVMLKRGAATPKGRNQKTVWQRFCDSMKSIDVAIAPGGRGVLEDDLVDAVAKHLTPKRGKPDRRREQAREALDGLCRTGWCDVVPCAGGRLVIPGPNAPGIAAPPTAIPETPEMPDFAGSDNLSSFG